MHRFLTFFVVAVVAICLIVSDPHEGPVALLVTVLVSGVTVFIIRRHSDEKNFLTYIFLTALCARLIFALVVHNFQMGMFVGPDAGFYDELGRKISDHWLGFGDPLDPVLLEGLSISGPGWGMNYLAGVLYLVTGKNFLAAQSFCCVIGAATAPMVYSCSEKIFHNRPAAKAAAVAIAFFPAFIIWSGQFLKDGLIVFLLVLSMATVVQIQKRFSWYGLALLVFSLFGILSLRFYIFYTVATAVVGALILGSDNSIKGFLKRISILVLIGFALTYLGVLRTSNVDLQTYGSLERIQVSRAYQAESGESGYGVDEDVSTVGGAISALPTGFSYLMFAPFPWEVKNFRQSLTLPEVFLWWSLMPLLVVGMWHTLRHRLRDCFPIFIFTVMLTFAYSIFQSNLGAAYRQRTQIQVFLFMFIAVGWALIMEKRADRKLVELNRKRALERELRTRFQQSHQV